ncbi:hypothetical protein T484DRAFT_2798835 [Baffinella frigidus]|nr:hypothetical protein T484DRAFT_2798835 [Cryptophyta sp. CCMP2293]
MAATDQVVCSDVKFGQLDANGQIRSRTISLQVPPLYEEFLAVIQQHLPNGQKIRETTRTTREIVADVRLSDGRVVHHDNHSIFRAEIQKNTSSGGRIPFSFKVALEFEENVDPPAPLKFAITCAGISACAPSWDQRHRAKAPLQLNVCCEMVASYCSPAAEELLRDENLGAGPLALELVQTAVAIEVSTRNNALANGFDAWLEPAEVTDEKAFQSLHAWMNATERLRAEHFLMFSGSFKGTNLQMFFVPFTALETGSSKLRLGVFMKPAVEVVEGRTFWTKYTTGAREAAAALQHMTDKAKTLIKNGKLPVAFDLDGVLISSDRDDTNTFRARPKAKQELNKLKEAGCLLGICSSACQGHVDKQRADHFHGVFDDARCVGIDVLVSDDRKKTFETVFPEYGDLCIGVDDRAVTSDTDWDKAQVDRVITIGNYHFRTCPPEAAFFEFETVAQLILTIKGEFLKQFDPCGGCWVADPASPKHFRPLKVVWAPPMLPHFLGGHLLTPHQKMHQLHGV